jgi:hypothetical protein
VTINGPLVLIIMANFLAIWKGTSILKIDESCFPKIMLMFFLLMILQAIWKEEWTTSAGRHAAPTSASVGLAASLAPLLPPS